MTAIDQEFDEVYAHFSSAYSGRLAAQNLYDDDDRSSRFQASSVTGWWTDPRITPSVSRRARALHQYAMPERKLYVPSTGSMTQVRPESDGASRTLIVTVI